jgi:foldase protein PrsA
MKIIGVTGIVVGLCFACCLGWAGEAEPGPVGGADATRVTVAGEVPPRPEFEAIAGVTGWVVNGKEISLQMVKDRAAIDHGPYVLQDMVAELLLQQEADRRGIVVTDEEVARKVASLREELGVRSEAALESFLRVKRVTREWLHSKARAYVLMEKVLFEQVHVDDREIERFYRLNQQAYRRNETVGYRIMRFLDKQSAEAALAEIRKGRSFEEVARETAQTPAEQAVAGNIRYHVRGQQSLPREFEAALLAAPLNQVAGPVEVMGSYFLIRVEQKLDPHQFTLDEVRDVIREQLRRQKLEQIVWPNWMRDQLERAQIEVVASDATPKPTPPATPEPTPAATPEPTPN